MEIRYDAWMIRLAVLAAVTIGAILLSLLIVRDFVIGTVTDPRSYSSRDDIVTAANAYPDSFRLQLLLAQAELAEAGDLEESLARAEAAVHRAIELSPSNFEARLLLATTRELRGDRAGSEAALKQALEFAPNNLHVRWKLANLLLREGKIDEAVPHLKASVEGDRSRLSGMFELLWEITGGDASKLEAATDSAPDSKLHLVSYLFQKQKFDEAANVYSKIDIEGRRRAPESSAYLNGLIAAGKPEMAYKLWLDLKAAPASGIWNGGFEQDPVEGLTVFDWDLSSNKYATILIDTETAKSGSRALRIEFTGIDTTRLENEIRQLVPVRAGKRYRLMWQVRTSSLNTPAGPRVYVTNEGARLELAVSDPIESGDSDWRRMSVEFAVPNDVRVVTVSVRRIPRFSYDEPTTGVVWLDDFRISEIP